MKYFFSSFFLIFICSCGNEIELFKAGRVWTYTIERNNDTIETIQMTIILDSSKSELISKWIYIKNKNDSFPIEFLSLRRINTNSISLFKQNRVISIGPPNLNTSPSSIYFPNLYFQTPFKKGEIIKNTYNYNIHNGNENIKKLEYEVENLGRIYYANALVQDSCWKLEENYFGESIAGAVIYYFHDTLGFVFIEYKFNNQVITLELSKLNFNKKVSR